MPTFTPSTPTEDHIFQDVTIAVPYTFAAGHVLTALEATQVNRYVATAVGNAWGAEIRRLLKVENDARAKAFAEKTYTGPTEVNAKGKTVPATATIADLNLSPADLQSKFNSKFTSYELGVGRQAAEATTPVDRLARTLASAKVKDLITAKGFKVRDFQTAKGSDGETSKFNELVENYIDANAWIIDAARAQLAALNAHTESNDSLDLTLAA